MQNKIERGPNKTLFWYYARAAVEAFKARDIANPTPNDIARQYLSGVPIIPRTTALEIQAMLPGIKRTIERELEYKTVLVCDRYYDDGCPNFPDNPDIYLANGRGRLSAGIHFVVAANDPIYLAWLKLHGKRAMGSIASVGGKISDGLQSELLDGDSVADILSPTIDVGGGTYLKVISFNVPERKQIVGQTADDCE